MELKHYLIDTSGCTLDQHRKIIAFFGDYAYMPVHATDAERVYDVFWNRPEPIDEILAEFFGDCLINIRSIV